MSFTSICSLVSMLVLLSPLRARIHLSMPHYMSWNCTLSSWWVSIVLLCQLSLSVKHHQNHFGEILVCYRRYWKNSQVFNGTRCKSVRLEILLKRLAFYNSLTQSKFLSLEQLRHEENRSCRDYCKVYDTNLFLSSVSRQQRIQQFFTSNRQHWV